jgi:serine protease 16
MTAILFWTLLLLSQPVVDGIYDYRYRDFLQRKNKEQQQVLTKTRDIGDVEELYLSQRLDHFDHNNAATFQQRYVATNRYIIDDPVSEFTFLCVGGEGPGFDKTVLVDSVHCTGDMLELAKRLSKDYQISVHVYALEHRYYGSSYPSFDNDESPVTIQNLKYLSSRQALEDLAHFVHTINEQQGKESKWVTFGGSYPGFMAAYARLKYPHLIFAGVSSSAPLDLKVDFPGYNHLVGADLKYSKVGGSETCFNIVKKGHDQAIALSQTNPLELGKMFNVCQPENLHARRNQEILL